MKRSTALILVGMGALAAWWIYNRNRGRTLWGTPIAATTAGTPTAQSTQQVIASGQDAVNAAIAASTALQPSVSLTS